MGVGPGAIRHGGHGDGVLCVAAPPFTLQGVGVLEVGLEFLRVSLSGKKENK